MDKPQTVTFTLSNTDRRFCMREDMCLQRGTNWVSKYNSAEFLLYISELMWEKIDLACIYTNMFPLEAQWGPEGG